MLRSLRNFLITFVIAGIIFVIAANLTSGIIVECIGPLFGITADDVVVDKNDSNQKPTEDESNDKVETSTKFSILLINTNYRPSQSSEFSSYDIARYPLNEKRVNIDTNSIYQKKIEATDFMILRGDSSKNEFTYTYLPACMMLTVRGEQVSLNDIYRDFGITFLTEKIRAATGFSIDYYSIYDLEDISFVVEYIGGVTCNVPVDITYEDEVVITKGNKNLNGKDVQMLLEFSDYANSSQRGQTFTGLVKKLMSKITNKVNKIDILSLHRASSNRVDTTVTITDINSLTDMLYMYPTGNSHELSYPGNYKKQDGVTVFNPNISAAITKFSKYR